MIKLIQINKSSPNNYRLQNIYINPKHIIFMSENFRFKQELIEGKINIDIDKTARFTKIKINENAGISEIIVVGAPDMIEEKIYNNSKKSLLKG